MRNLALILAAVTPLMLSSSLLAFEPDTQDELQLDVAKAILDIQKADPGIMKFFDGAAGYAVFPRVGKGGMGVGGAYGKGLMIVDDKAVGKTSLSQLTVGLRLWEWLYLSHSHEMLYLISDIELIDYGAVLHRHPQVCSIEGKTDWIVACYVAITIGYVFDIVFTFYLGCRIKLVKF